LIDNEDHGPKPSQPGHAPGRRRFVQGLALASLGLGTVWRDRAQALDPARVVTAAGGNRIDLEIGALPFNVTGRPRIATAVNGSVPGPVLRLREGEMLTLNVTNRLRESTSIHWHGLRLPSDQDGVPGLSFRGIAPGTTFTYRFPVVQSGTYWYHGHSGMQEQTGLYGAMILEPRGHESFSYDREHVVLLSDWMDEDPMRVLSNLKQQSDYYNHQRRTLGTLVRDVREQGFEATLDDRLMWDRMRMSPTDIMDVGGSVYTYLVNGLPPAANWTALYKPGERVRLRFINASSMTTFDVRIPGLPMTVVTADGSEVEPVTVDEFRMGVAETYDVIVEARGDAAYTIFAQAQDRSGYARGTLAPRTGMTAVVPALDPAPLRSMADMGMAMHDMGSMDTPGHASDHDMAGMDMSDHDMAGMKMPGHPADHDMAGHDMPGMDMSQPQSRLGEPGTGLEDNGRRVLVYTDLAALHPDAETPPVDREITLHLTGNMQRFIWGFDGRKFSEAGPIRVKLGERVRFVLINDTMMEHPIHLHGFLFSLENGRTGKLPLKHTLNVKPAGRVSFVFTADTPGHWAFHCHLMYHMEAGMFRTVLVS